MSNDNFMKPMTHRFLRHEGNVLAELLDVELGDILAIELIMIALIF